MSQNDRDSRYDGPTESRYGQRPTPEQWGFIAHQLGELTPDTIGVTRP